ncbi:phage holin family protein [Corynebacterium striatum]|uniref:phage holin family protein n=1 Tax=Corynebacterium striatum TaxID=43770 RepID=UPI001419D0C2|nr:phage holin family protein [Corynebacterium striatum]NHY09954.1 phage holin family protein [Corynebacterium striatum]NHY35770.1 phage holin family protein [Corynebacterium striatum]HAT1130873.1 phage holin family protein [Corynebacterium striatum]HAT1138657.1 phage holin family protein [Corynebacterium striatum]HAT1141155.1 phage holin family protein [Corynebacterium striatum]
MSNDGLFTDGSDQFAPKVNAIPLSDADTSRPGEASVGQLVSNATEQMSQLVRSEVELAKTELAQSAKKGGIGAGMFGVAGTIALYSSFFFFFFLAELLDLWLDRWAAFLIVFLIMLVLAAIVGFIGFKNIKKVKAPEKTIQSTKELKKLVPGKATKSVERGLYT